MKKNCKKRLNAQLPCVFNHLFSFHNNLKKINNAFALKLLSHFFFNKAMGILQLPPPIMLSPKPLDEIQPNLVRESLT